MRLRALAASLAALVLLAAPGTSSAQRARPRAPAAHRDWSLTAMRTPEGGVRIGNPAAPVKLIEYGSITCPHCAAFSGEAAAALRGGQVRAGRVSWEYRPYLIFPTDPAAFLLLNCLPPASFFPAMETLYATQRQWFGRVQALPEAELQRLQALPPIQMSTGMIRAAGLDAFFRARGLSAAQVNACLADRAALQRLVGVTRHAGELGVEGTPTFFINGRSVGTQDWARLQPMLTAG